MSILDEKLQDVAEVLQKEKNRKLLYQKIEKCQRKYEWARIIMLIGGKKALMDKKKLSFNNIYKEYGMRQFYDEGAFRKAIGTALTGKGGRNSPNCKVEEMTNELDKFNGGIYNWQGTLEELINNIYNEAKTSNSKENLEELKKICSIFVIKDNGELMNIIDNPVKSVITKAINTNKQIILTGAPGTGKTWSVRKFVEEKCKEAQYKFVQFHPSYDYSDFVEGLRPVVIKGKEEPTFVCMDGVFKEFCRHIVEENNKEKNEEKKYYFIVDEINRADLAKVFGELMFGLEESYRGKDNPIQTQYKNLVTYKIVTKNDRDCSNSMYAQDDIGKAIPIENDVFEDGFYIPENLFFIGTMNDIDRSVDSMDFALRRRFQWIDIKANEIMESSLHSILDKDNCNQDSEKYKRINALAERIIQMNNNISGSDYKFGLSESYHIGPAYFKNLDISSDENLKTSLRSIFDTNITSILKEYTRGRKSEDINVWINRCRAALLEEN